MIATGISNTVQQAAGPCPQLSIIWQELQTHNALNALARAPFSLARVLCTLISPGYALIYSVHLVRLHSVIACEYIPTAHECGTFSRE